MADNLITYTKTETTPSRDLGETSGETPSISLTRTGTRADLSSRQFTDWESESVLEVSSSSLADGRILSQQAESVFNKLNIERNLRPMYGNRRQYAAHIFSAGGFSSQESGIALGGLQAGTDRWWPGFTGNLWLHFKQFLSYQRDYDLEFDRIAPISVGVHTVRYTNLMGGMTETVDNAVSASKEVEVFYYEPVNPNAIGTTNVELFPVAQDQHEQTITLDAGGVFDEEIELDAWVLSVNQPVAVDEVLPGVQTGTGSYCVAGADGLPVKADQWTDNGGRIDVFLTDRPNVIRVRVVAPATPTLVGVDNTVKYAPYSIAATTTEGGLYPSLHITGTGMGYSKKSVIIPTGADPSSLGLEESATLDSVFIRSLAEAYEFGNKFAGNNSGQKHSLSLSSTTSYPPGTIFKHDFSEFRVVSKTSTRDEFSYEAEKHTIFLVFDEIFAGQTFGDFNNTHTGTIGEYNISPLKKVL